ncbi:MULTISPECIES: thioredoxin domain-containing protein [unclassified Methanoculleus]|uniref:thioredoxin domain-containing protein n=3 Tax=Methanoculleus TaxID=45989 RepID=UPI0025E51112|nr:MULTISPECIES: thioredoxin domain-containing protein [unclassified Methanoculleus]MCK9316751.1 thioredoxin domain-containing protein [Methanoculleus sp.]MDD2252788.1 thioredoxin domain-containing protein [Methanoculleus sp.]MDD2788123.1 thioredoxin domain-containing protein [Methanoculleus sp.]MDD3215229.1 thioredoxin domain-containing protein [Methanoculleus sp.]MDD4313031.1 thioredoxin domain-containing protein [Methanoculleus sp.]
MNPARGHDPEAPEAPVREESPPNRLIHEQSPYLLQHAHNPVDWYPWGEEAFSRAQEEGRPIFLSIGYSACHWCHVMEEESFRDPQVAKLLNDVFVCIKVDREERPDIDQVYMAAAHALTGTGGWPLTILMTSDKKPFFAASYIPKESRYGMTGLLDLIPRISKVWQSQRQDLENAGGQVMEALQGAARTPPGESDLDEAVLDEAYETLFRVFDGENGGFGDAPKFPTPHNLIFLLRYGNRTGKEPAYTMVEKTLHAMRRGGIFDQVGYGFHRYSTDAEWFVPHFEKMLYDQALLVMAYTEAYLATGREEFARTARETIAYVLRDMTDPAGGFYSAEDADSEGEEGKFYLWTKDEIVGVLGEDDGERFSRVFNVTEPGNYREQPGARRTGKNILRMRRPLASWAHEFSMSEEDLSWFVEGARQRLFAAREKRVRPAKDDKILTDWNALMIAALAKAARAFDDPAYLAAAEKATAFVLENLRRPDGRLLHRYRNGEAGLAATLDDYAFMLWALIEVYEASFAPRYLRTATELARDLVARYRDCEGGGFFFTPDDGDAPVRQKPVYDGAIPSGNSVAMQALFALARMTANLELEETADRMKFTFAGTVRKSPAGHTHFLTGLEFMLGPNFEVVVTGMPGAEDTTAMVRAIRSRYTPDSLVIFRPSGEERPEIVEVAGFTRDIVMIEEKATAYVCTNYACDIPTTDIDEMLRLMRSRERSPEPIV